mmetsp:Transcript_677/g.1575  ORF Transcript_677/g.1575 Transcript_677/m.1575 type:complete len:427 (+) Transcript_677:120-1400(+)
MSAMDIDGPGSNRPDDQNEVVGVGIVFQPLDDGTLYVKRLKEGEPAARSGLIKVGDCLCEINGRDVFRKPVEEVKRILLGPPGSTVRLGLHRGTDPRTPLIQVALQRCRPGQPLVGVGLIFRSDATGALFVRQLQEGEPAERSGQIRVGDCIVEVDGVDVYRKPISFFTNLMLGPPGSVVTLGFKRAGATQVERVMLRRSVPEQPVAATGEEAVSASNMQLANEVAKERVEQERLRAMLNEKKDKLRETTRLYAQGSSAMGGRMNEEAQRKATFLDQWPYTQATHPGVTPDILAADGFYFTPTSQVSDTVVCFFCDLQLGDWERSDDAKAVHRKLSPNCPIVKGTSCGNVPLASKAGASTLGPFASAQERLEEILAAKAALLQSVTSLESALDDARRQIAAAVQARKRIQQELSALAMQQKNDMAQ